MYQYFMFAVCYTVGVPQSGQNLPATILRHLGQKFSPPALGCTVASFMGFPHCGQNFVNVALVYVQPVQL